MMLQSDVENNMNGGMASSRVPMLNALRQLGCLHSRPAYRPLTKFEARGERLGHGVWDLMYHRQ